MFHFYWAKMGKSFVLLGLTIVACIIEFCPNQEKVCLNFFEIPNNDFQCAEIAKLKIIIFL